MEETTYTSQTEQSCKTWSYSEKTSKHTTHHTISVTKERFTHEAQIKESSKAMRQRTDLSLKNVNSVYSYFGYSKNIIGAVILAIIALVSLIGGFASIANNTAIGVVLIIVALLFAVLAVIVYRRLKPAFILEIETVIPSGTLKQSKLSYGSASLDLSKTKHSPLFYLLLIVAWPVGIIYLIYRLLLTPGKSNKYRFLMDAEVGNEIVDTIGAMLIEK